MASFKIKRGSVTDEYTGSLNTVTKPHSAVPITVITGNEGTRLLNSSLNCDVNKNNSLMSLIFARDKLTILKLQRKSKCKHAFLSFLFLKR